MNPFEKYEIARDALLKATQGNIGKLQADFAIACEEFRKWAQENPAKIPKETFKHTIQEKTWLSHFDEKKLIIDGEKKI